MTENQKIQHISDEENCYLKIIKLREEIINLREENCYFTDIILERNKKLEKENKDKDLIIRDIEDFEDFLLKRNENLERENDNLIDIIDDEFEKRMKSREEIINLRIALINALSYIDVKMKGKNFTNEWKDEWELIKDCKLDGTKKG